MPIEINKIICGDCLAELKKMPDNFVNCCVTSPPYWGLRDYGTAQWKGGDPGCDHKVSSGGPSQLEGASQRGRSDVYRGNCPKCGAVRIDNQIGLEKTPEEYVGKMVTIFREVRRVLRDDGTLWLNLGDSFASGKGTCYNPGGNTSSFNVHLKAANVHPLDRGNKSTLAKSGLKPKDLVGIPWRVAFALQADGWYLRQDIIWHKPNPMPESVTDRCTKAHEYIFLLAKSQKYYYDAEAIKEAARFREDARPFGKRDSGEHGQSGKKYIPSHGKWSKEGKQSSGRRIIDNVKHARAVGADHDSPFGCTRNKRSVWTVNTKPFPDAHFAVFPPDLIEPCILAGSPKGGIILDPFMGSGTTAIVSLRHDRKYIGIELNPEYIKISNKRILKEEKQIKEARAQLDLFNADRF